MIEKALYEHLQNQASLVDHLTRYGDRMAIFNHEVPADNDPYWAPGSQYGRIVFVVDPQGDPERGVSGTLVVDILCNKGEQFPEEIEPIIREAIDGYFFAAADESTMAAQWKNSSYFTEPTEKVVGCTCTFDLLAFPMLTTFNPDVVARINRWTSRFAGIHVINYDRLPANAWKPEGDDCAVYWRLVTDDQARWIPDTFHTIWRTANLRCHIFAKDIARATSVAKSMTYRLYAEKRLLKEGETPIMVNQRNTVDIGADPLRTGQLSVQATYGVIVYFSDSETLENITIEEKKGETDGN